MNALYEKAFSRALAAAEETFQQIIRRSSFPAPGGTGKIILSVWLLRKWLTKKESNKSLNAEKMLRPLLKKPTGKGTALALLQFNQQVRHAEFPKIPSFISAIYILVISFRDSCTVGTRRQWSS